MNNIQEKAIHTSSKNIYLAVFATLAVLTILTVTVSYLKLNRLGAITVAVAIASLKVSLIAAFFMHLKMEKKIIHALFYTALFFVLLLLFLVIPDLGWSCAVCFGEGSENLQRGFFWGILLLLFLPFSLITTLAIKIATSYRKKIESDAAQI